MKLSGSEHSQQMLSMPHGTSMPRVLITTTDGQPLLDTVIMADGVSKGPTFGQRIENFITDFIVTFEEGETTKANFTIFTSNPDLVDADWLKPKAQIGLRYGHVSPEVDSNDSGVMKNLLGMSAMLRICVWSKEVSFSADGVRITVHCADITEELKYIPVDTGSGDLLEWLKDYLNGYPSTVSMWDGPQPIRYINDYGREVDSAFRMNYVSREDGTTGIVVERYNEDGTISIGQFTGMRDVGMFDIFTNTKMADGIILDTNNELYSSPVINPLIIGSVDDYRYLDTTGKRKKSTSIAGTKNYWGPEVPFGAPGTGMFSSKDMTLGEKLKEMNSQQINFVFDELYRIPSVGEFSKQEDVIRLERSRQQASIQVPEENPVKVPIDPLTGKYTDDRYNNTVKIENYKISTLTAPSAFTAYKRALSDATGGPNGVTVKGVDNALSHSARDFTKPAQAVYTYWGGDGELISINISHRKDMKSRNPKRQAHVKSIDSDKQENQNNVFIIDNEDGMGETDDGYGPLWESPAPNKPQISTGNTPYLKNTELVLGRGLGTTGVQSSNSYNTAMSDDTGSTVQPTNSAYNNSPGSGLSTPTVVPVTGLTYFTPENTTGILLDAHWEGKNTNVSEASVENVRGIINWANSTTDLDMPNSDYMMQQFNELKAELEKLDEITDPKRRMEVERGIQARKFTQERIILITAEEAHRLGLYDGGLPEKGKSVTLSKDYRTNEGMWSRNPVVLSLNGNAIGSAGMRKGKEYYTSTGKAFSSIYGKYTGTEEPEEPTMRYIEVITKVELSVAEAMSRMDYSKLRSPMSAMIVDEEIAEISVIGRPTLRCSQPVVVRNVGTKYSKKWWVTRCSHKIDASGYITNMTATLGSNIKVVQARVTTDLAGLIRAATKRHQEDMVTGGDRNKAITNVLVEAMKVTGSSLAADAETVKIHPDGVIDVKAEELQSGAIIVSADGDITHAPKLTGETLTGGIQIVE